jgi:hypothetical protein
MQPLNLATTLVANNARSETPVTYGRVYQAWKEFYVAPEQDFRAELREGMRNGYLSMSITIETRLTPDTKIFVTERLKSLLALEV